MTQSFLLDLERKVAFHKRQLAVWEAALAAARDERKSSVRVAKPSGGKKLPTVPLNPTEFILRMIESTQGAKAGEIRDSARQRLLPFADQENFPYKQLSRLKRLGRVIATDGVYSLVPKERSK